MPSEDIKILEFCQCQRSDILPFVIHADYECLIEKVDEYKNNPENTCTAKVGEHITSGLSMSTTFLMYTDIKITWKGLVNL